MAFTGHEGELARLSAVLDGLGPALTLVRGREGVGTSTLVDRASTEWQDEIAALRASLTILQTAIQQLASNPGTTTVAATRTALVGVRTAAQNLFAAVSADCPSLAPSPSPTS